MPSVLPKICTSDMALLSVCNALRFRSLAFLLSRTQSISGTGTPRMGEADAIGSPIIQESKAKERRREEGECLLRDSL